MISKYFFIFGACLTFLLYLRESSTESYFKLPNISLFTPEGKRLLADHRAEACAGIGDSSSNSLVT